MRIIQQKFDNKISEDIKQKCENILDHPLTLKKFREKEGLLLWKLHSTDKYWLHFVNSYITYLVNNRTEDKLKFRMLCHP